MAEASAIDPNRPTRIVVVGFILCTASVGLFLEHALGALFDALRINNPSLVGEWTVSSLIGYVLAVVIAVICYLNPRLNSLSFEVANELKKTSWPNMDDTRTNTIAVIVFSAASAAVLGIFDVVSSKIMTQWIPDALSWISRHV